MSWALVLSSFSTCASLRWSAELASSARLTTAPSSSTYSRQQNQSVQARSRIGPYRHCTCSWIYPSSYCIIRFKI